MIGHEVFVTGFLATASLMRYVTLRRKVLGRVGMEKTFATLIHLMLHM